MMLRRKIGRISEVAALAVLNRYPRIVFVHVPKCAGSAVSDSLFDGIYPAPFSVTRAYCKIDSQASRTASGLLGVHMKTCNQAVLIHAMRDPFARFVTGHLRAYPEVVEQFPEWKFVTVLREPTARFISSYVFHRYKPLLRSSIDCDFTDFLKTDRARFEGRILTEYFSGMSDSEVEANPDSAISAALDNLERFFSVGFVDELEAWAESISRALGRRVRIQRKNSSPKPEVLRQLEQSPELRERVRDVCAIDLQFYTAAQMRFKETASSPRTSPAAPEQVLVASR